MIHKRIKYICFYDTLDSPENRGYSMAAINKLDYIFSSLNRNDIGVDIISMAGAVGNTFRCYPASKKHIGINTLQLFASFTGTAHNKTCQRINYIILSLQLFFYLLFHVKPQEEIIVYHSLGYVRIINILKRIKNFSLIGEIEEIYQDVVQCSSNMCQAEYSFFSLCDKYIFPTELLNAKLNNTHKPYVIIYGAYSVNAPIVSKLADNKIHIVYAGTFDTRKGGAAAAAAAAEWLPINYHVHICGFGTEEEVTHIKNLITEISKKSKATISYEGLKKGDDYTLMLQRCHIGLSTQDPTAAFNATSFPSKILSYLGNGLNVVSISIPAIVNSSIGDYIYYYNTQTPQNIAKAIMTVPIPSNKDTRTIVEKLSQKFDKDIKNLL